MRLFSHTIAEYVCTKRCGNRRAIVAPNLSLFDLIAAGLAAVPLWLFFLFDPWSFPWYYLFNIFAGELLLIFLAGPIVNLLVAPFTARGAMVCTECGARMASAGRHYDPKGSVMPRCIDFALFIAFVAANVAVWVVLLNQPLP